MQIKLTDPAINKATREAKADGKRRELADEDCPGLRIRITPAGARGWVLGMRDALGNPRRFALGEYPGMGISGARDAARTMRHKVKHEAADPIAERRRNLAIGKAARQGEGTLEALLDEYPALRKNGQPVKSWGVSRPTVELVFKPLLKRPVAVITLDELQRCANGYPSKASAAFAVRTLRPVLKWAAAPGQRRLSIELTRIETPITVAPRKRVLSEAELKVTLPVLRDLKRPHLCLFRFLLLTLARREEAATALWRHVDLDAAVWTIPVTKNGEPHEVPLSRQAVELLRSMGPGKADELVFRSRGGTKLGNWDRVTKTLIVETGLGSWVVPKGKGKTPDTITMKDGSAVWTRHDLRRTAATMLGHLGVLPDLIEAALNHVSIHSPLAATYNRSRYRPQVADALQRLADRLDQIEGVTEPAVMVAAAE